MIAVFYDGYSENAHAEFQQWRQQHQDGYFLNYRSLNDTMLHRSPCWHHGDDQARSEEDGSLTAKMKLCSTNREDLERWADKNGIENLKRCQHC